MSQGANAVANGIKGEAKVAELLINNGINFTPQKRVYYYSKRYYIADFITDDMVIEVKDQSVDGSCQDKLLAEFAKLLVKTSGTNKQAILVYDGDILTNYVQTSPAFEIMESRVPEVLVMSLQQFELHVSNLSTFV